MFFKEFFNLKIKCMICLFDFSLSITMVPYNDTTQLLIKCSCVSIQIKVHLP